VLPAANVTSDASATNRCGFSNVVGTACGPAVVDLNVTPDGPPQLCSPDRRGVAGLGLCIICGKWHTPAPRSDYAAAEQQTNYSGNSPRQIPPPRGAMAGWGSTLHSRASSHLENPPRVLLKQRVPVALRAVGWWTICVVPGRQHTWRRCSKRQRHGTKSSSICFQRRVKQQAGQSLVETDGKLAGGAPIVGTRVLSYALHDLPRHERATHLALTGCIFAGSYNAIGQQRDGMYFVPSAHF
jgi:hypothetical protein